MKVGLIEFLLGARIHEELQIYCTAIHIHMASENMQERQETLEGYTCYRNRKHATV